MMLEGLSGGPWAPSKYALKPWSNTENERERERVILRQTILTNKGTG